MTIRTRMADSLPVRRGWLRKYVDGSLVERHRHGRSSTDGYCLLSRLWKEVSIITSTQKQEQHGCCPSQSIFSMFIYHFFNRTGTRQKRNNQSIMQNAGFVSGAVEIFQADSHDYSEEKMTTNGIQIVHDDSVTARDEGFAWKKDNRIKFDCWSVRSEGLGLYFLTCDSDLPFYFETRII